MSHLIGVDAQIYVGSWSQWSRTRGRPIATGSTPLDAVHAAI